jgi:hypothetical protein
VSSGEARIERLEARTLARCEVVTDPSPWDWYAPSCPCGVPPGECREHPRCVRLKEAFGNYCRQRRGSEWIDFPADGNPEEDMTDARLLSDHHPPGPPLRRGGKRCGERSGLVE